MEFATFTVQYDPELVTAEFMSEHLSELEGVFSVSEDA